MSHLTVSPQKLGDLCGDANQPILLIDVRTPVEFREAHVAHAENVPLDKLDPQSFVRERQRTFDQPIYLICRSGSRGEMACKKFVAAGFTNVVNVEGGTQACIDAGLPIVRGKKAMSLERQVRIAAGFLVLLGILLWWLVHPAMIALSGFVGAGLMFAGITDTCGMGMLLAKMPWNQVKPTGGSSCHAKQGSCA